MAGSHVKRKSDFSIARILSDDSKDGDGNAGAILLPSVSEGCAVQHCDVDPLNLVTEGGVPDTLNGQRVMNLNVCAEEDGTGVAQAEEDSLSWTGKNALKICESLKSQSELQWLQCTRYRPPRLPRRAAANRSCKRRPATHPRIPFTSLQLEVLEDKYKSDPYLTRKDVLQLSGLLRLPQSRVKIWFQNRRARDRRENKVSSSLPIT